MMVTKGLKRLLVPGPRFDAVLPEAWARPSVEHYISEHFLTTLGASVRDFMPLLLTMSCRGEFSAVMGLRSAVNQSLFLEQYLPETVEAVLGEVSGRRVNRGDILEIGNLVATRRGANQLLFLILGALMLRSHYKWLVFTVTPQVQKSIERLGLDLLFLCEANPCLLKNTHLTQWGMYYEQQPAVMAARVADVTSLMTRHKLYSRIMSLFDEPIGQLSAQVDGLIMADERYAFTA